MSYRDSAEEWARDFRKALRTAKIDGAGWVVICAEEWFFPAREVLDVCDLREARIEKVPSEILVDPDGVYMVAGGGYIKWWWRPRQNTLEVRQEVP